MLEILIKMRNTMMKSLEEKERRLRETPKGYLVAQTTLQGTRMYWVRNEKRNGITVRKQKRLRKEDELIANRLRDKFMLKDQVKAYRNNLKLLNKLIEGYISCDDDTAAGKLKEPYKSLPGFKGSHEAAHDAVQSENTYHSENLIHKNSVGELFRSKAEMHISELMIAQGIPYRYERKLELDGEVKYPDFTVKNTGGKKKYIEYFGMTDKEEYGKSMVEKINWYLDHGFIPGRDVLFLYENSESGMDLPVIAGQINALLAA